VPLRDIHLALTTTLAFLNWWAFHCSIRAVYTTIALQRL